MIWWTGARKRRALLLSATEAELDAKIKAEQVGAILVFAGDVNVELAGWDLARQSNSVLELVLAGRQWTLEVSIAFSCLLTDIEPTGEQPDQTELDDDICERAVLLNKEEDLEKKQESASVIIRGSKWDSRVS